MPGSYYNAGDPLPNTFPILRDDPALTDGSLMLIQPGHSADNLAPGAVPTNNQVGGNIAWREAAKLCGKTLAQRPEVEPTFVIGAGWTADKAKLERTPKGSIHGIVSQTVDIATTNAGWTLPLAIRTYLEPLVNAYPAGVGDHIIALFLHMQVTRGGTTSDCPIACIVRTANGSRLIDIASLVSLPPATTNAPGSPVVFGGAINTVGAELLRGAGATAWDPGQNPVAADTTGWFGWGPFAPYAGGALHEMPSYVFRRAHLIDLTASGMTFDQIYALELAIRTANLAAGGAWYADALPTAVATIA